MKLTKKLESEILNVYNTYWDGVLKGDIDLMAACLDDDFQIIGSAEGEVFLNKKDAMQFYNATANQIAGKVELRNREIKKTSIDEFILLSEISDIYVLIEDEWDFYSKFRISSLLKKKNNGWKFVQIHASIPDIKTTEGEQLAFEKVQKENLELRDAVRRRTAELEQKNSELEIEAALERTRAVALSMKEPADMLKVCRIISEQLELLGINDVRNVQTAIVYEEKKTYLNYEYYRLHDKTLITEVDYNIHPAQAEFANQMLKGPDSFFSKSFRGTELEEWIENQKKSPQFVDSYLEKANSVNYYFYSLGPVALGVSAYSPLTEKDLQIFKRFRNVFDLAYRRYTDIARAEAQAREAQIEAALEKVRSRSLAMHKSDELQDIVNTVFERLKDLKIDMNVASIFIFKEGSKDWEQWVATSTTNYSKYFHIPYIDNLVFRDLEEAKNRGKDFYSVRYSFKQKNEWFSYAFDHTEYKQVPKDRKKYILESKFFLMSFALSKHSGIQIARYEGKDFSLEENEILKRFSSVFEQAYIRFLDLQRAEAQAREAQIEAALERVRSRTMGMQKSDELKEVIQLVYEQFVQLKINVEHTGFILDYESRDDLHIWLADQREIPSEITIPCFDSPPNNSIKEAKEKGEDFFTYLLTFEEKNKFYRNLFKFIPGVPEESLEYYFDCPGLAGSGVLLENIGLYIENFSGTPYSDEENNTLMRFGKVFQQTYTRFLDLQKAEAQVREAQIENALEKVRSRSLAMHKSDELKEVVTVLFERLRELNLTMDTANIEIYRNDFRNYEMWVANSNYTYPEPFNYVYFDDLVNNEIVHHKELAQISGEEVFTRVYFSEIKNKFWKYLFEHTMFGQLPDDRKNLILKANAWSVSCVYSRHSGIVLMNYNDSLHSKEELNILKRFSRVFEQAYIRFLDLEKSEAQAREAQIQLALERVRARTMAMQRSDELKDAALLLFQQVEALGVPAFASGFNIWDDDRKAATAWMGGKDRIQPPFKTSSSEDIFLRIYEAAERGELLFVEEQTGEALKTHYEYMISIPVFKEVVDKMAKTGVSLPTFQINHCAFFSKGYLMFITFEPVPNAYDIFKRFATVFEQTYTRFLDLQTAEEQARETQIQLALERIRARTMAMHSSDELMETSQVLFEQFNQLGENAEQISIAIINEEESTFEVYVTYQGYRFERLFKANFDSHPVIKKIYSAWKSENKSSVIEISGNELKSYNDWRSKFGEVKYQSTGGESTDKWIMNLAFFSKGMISFSTYSPVPEATINLLERFAAVFDLTYTRFLDLRKAEIQAREAQIEASLERVRAVAMSMHTSDDLLSICEISFKEFRKLGFDNLRNTIIHVLYDEEKFLIDYDYSEQLGGYITRLEYNSHPIVLDYLRQIKSAEDAFAEVAIKDDQLNSWKDFRRNSGQHDDPRLEKISALYYYGYSIGIGDIGISTFEPIDESQIKILKRFRNVFDLTYRRYNDIALAEKQARETQIQLALERVRARTMAMHKSEELSETSFVLFEQLKELGEVAEQMSITIYNEKEEITILYSTIYGTKWEETGRIPYKKHSALRKIYQAWKEKQKSIVIDLSGEELNDFNKFKMKYSTQYRSEEDLPKDRWIMHYVFFSKGALVFSTHKPRSPETIKLLERFAGVFDLTYTRFLDLQKAEALAREAQIETAIEKVRTRTMAMQRSDELADTAAILFKQLINLGIEPNRLYIAIIKDDIGDVEFWITDEDGSKVSKGFSANLQDNSSFQKMYDGWKEQKKSITLDMKGKELEEYFQHLGKLNVPFRGGLSQKRRVQNIAYFSSGFIGIASPDSQPKETIDLLERFAAVFNLTYTRFNDLQQAEAQNRIIQAENERKTMELEEARQLQLAMLPKELPQLPNLDIAVYMQTATEVGGDYYDFLVGIDGTLTTIIGDATGHGMKAGTVVTITKSLFNSMAVNENILGTFEEISQVIKGMKFRQLAMCLLMMKIRGNRLSISSAAMPPALIYRAKNKTVEEVFLKGMPLGTMTKFPYKKSESHLYSGDTILLYSDGLPELGNDKGQMYGYDRIQKEYHSVGEKAPARIVEHFKHSASQWANGKEPDDDVTFVVIKVK